MRLLIKNGTIVRLDRVADILVEDGIIKKIGAGLEETADRVIDASGLHVFSGFVDLHCHLRDPGYTYKEDILTGTRAAAAGGFTLVCCMPNTNPPLDTEELIAYIKEHKSMAGVLPVACITKGQKGQTITDFAALKRAGAVAFSDDGLPVTNAAVMRDALLAAKETNTMLMLHEEDLLLRGDGCVNEGDNARTAGLKGIPASAEETMIARDIVLAEEIDVPLHICHVSTLGSVRLIRDAKKRGVRITCETAPHYFSLDDSLILEGNTNAKVNPPLRTKKDVRAILAGIADGTIDLLATDHAPHSEEDKQGGFSGAASGLIGLETAFSLACTHLLHTGILSLPKLESFMSARPREIIGIGGRVAEGEPADIAICDINETYCFTKEQICSKSKNSPFIGNELRGKVCYTIVNGGITYDRQAD